MRKPSVLSASGLAASIAVIAILSFAGNGTPEVQAAVILERLNDQLGQDPRFEVTLESVSVEPVVVNGTLQVWHEKVAGNFKLGVQIPGAPDGATAEAEGLLALTGKDGWMLLRKLSMSSPEGQVMLDGFLGPGKEVLVRLPDDPARSNQSANVFTVVLELLRRGMFTQVTQELIASHGDNGMTLEKQPDGTLLLSLPIENAKAVTAVEALVSEILPSSTTVFPDGSMGFMKRPGDVIMTIGETEVVLAADATRETLAEELERLSGGRVKLTKFNPSVDEDGRLKSVRMDISIDGVDFAPVIMKNLAAMLGDDNKQDHELIGSTLSVVYDPATKLARSFRFQNLGPTKGSINVTLRKGPLDPALLDPEPVTTPNTRIVDFTALEALIKQIGRKLD
jgi:hypothetical protein